MSTVAEEPRAYINRKADASTEWGTPPDFFARVNQVFGPFQLDPASNCGAHGEPKNNVCGVYYCLGCGQDGLEEPWYGSVYVNPPFDNIPLWVNKAEDEVYGHRRADKVVMLLPANRTGRKWWQNMRPKHIEYLPGRLKFVGADNSAPFDCALVMWWQL